jgi:hypothetical protein
MGRLTGMRPMASDEEAPAGRVIAVLVGLLRTGTLLLASIHLASRASGDRTAYEAMALTVVGATSVGVFIRAALRGRRWLLDEWSASAETLAGLAGLLLLAAAIPESDRVGSDFWMLPWTVTTVILIAAACRRCIHGLLASLVLAGGYLAATAPLSLGSAIERGFAVTALNNSISYPFFFILGLIGFRLLRLLSGQVDMLRRRAARQEAERARLDADIRTYRIGHDIPKAYLRELRRAGRPASELRGWAVKSSRDLHAKIATDPRARFGLAENYRRSLQPSSTVCRSLLIPTGLPTRCPMFQC